MADEIDTHIKLQHAPMQDALMRLVRIPSVCDEGAGGFPFGEPIDRALREALRIAGDLGFRTHYGEGGYYGYAEAGAGSEMLGILGHLDVVPAGNLADWHTDPFAPVVKDGLLFGRGAQDDKGPMMAALFAVKALMDAGVTFNKRVRFIFGTDEETLWRCINRYKQREEWPGMGFSPDSRFPLTFAEKGLLQLHLEAANDSGVHLGGGSAFNAVPDSVTYAGEKQDDVARQLDALGFAHARSGEGITVKGKAAHAMIPEEGINAIGRLCIALAQAGVASRTIQFIAHEIGEDPYATRIFGDCEDAPSGRLKCNIGKIELDARERLSIDIRIPVTVAKDDVVSKLVAAAAQYGLEYKEFDWLAPIYLPLDHPLIQTLMQVYGERSGDTASRPAASGGATYARAIDNCVAFGALTPEETLTEHQPNERAVLANLHSAMEIYARAVYALTR